MKRRRCQLLPEATRLKRPTKNPRNGDVVKPCQMIQILAQYGLLESITTHLFPKDLYSLAATSKAAYRAIFPRKESRCSLLKKMQCDGRGIAIRKACHQKSQYSSQSEENIQCGTLDTVRSVESRPCVSCQATTCDECRIHCVYQSVRQPADEPDELDSFSGFVLLSGEEMGILSPAHLQINGAIPWDSKPRHDQGFLDNPLDSAVFAPIVEIDRMINANLGARPLMVTLSSGTPHPSPVIRAFWEVTEERKRPCCVQCFEKYQKSGKGSHEDCHCTLKSHFLDRWLCLRCHQREERHIRTISSQEFGENVTKCSCGQILDEATERVVCLWCFGGVANPWGTVDVDESRSPSLTSSD